MSTRAKRAYDLTRRSAHADARKTAILRAAATLFARDGIDKVTIAAIGRKAGVAGSTVYAAYTSKEGLLRALMTASLFGPRFQAAQALVQGVSDPVRLVALTANIARAIYESESAQLGLLRAASGFSPALSKLEQEFERRRYAMQEERLRALRASARMKTGITFDEARRIMWMFTSRDVYRMLVHEGGWTLDRYEAWLADSLVTALVEPGA